MAPTYSGVITVTTAGTAVQGTDTGAGYFFIKAKSVNTGLGYVGNVSGDVASTNGYELSAGEVIGVSVRSLKSLYFDAAVSGEGFTWIKAGGQVVPGDAPIEE